MSVQATVLNLLLDLRERFGLTYLFISHDLSVVRRFCDRVAIMYLGRIVEHGADRARFSPRRGTLIRGALLAAAPRLSGRRSRSRPGFPGEPPSAARLPPGCAFAPRCPRRRPAAGVIHPVLAPHGAALVACHRAPALAESG